VSASPHARARVTTWGIWIGLAVAALVALDFPWKSRVQDAGFDAYQTLSPRQIESMPAVVVAIDERSLAALGQWPWPRTILARLIDAINRYQPAAIGIDILMPEADRLSPERIVPEVAARDPALAAGLAALPSNDTELARAIAAAPVVLALAGTPAPTDRVLRVAPITVRNLHDEGADIPRMPGVARYEGALASLDVLDRAASGHGLLSVEPADGVLRRIPLLASIDGTLAPSFALELLRTAIKAPSLRIEAKGSDVRSVAVGDLVTATEPDAAVRVHYSHRDARRFVSAVDVLAGTVEPDRLRHKLVIIGATGLGLVDYQTTALSERMPGSEIHAQLLESLLDHTLLTRPAYANALEAGVFLALGALLWWATPRYPPRYVVALVLVCVAIMAGAGYLAFRTQRSLFDALIPSAGLLVFFGALLALSLAEATRQRRKLEAEMQVAREHNARMAGELEAARRIQTGLLPTTDFLRGDPRIEVAAAMVPARETGGDLYDFFRLDADRIFISIGDVAGKGLSASIFMAVSRALFKSATLRSPDATIGELMRDANAEVSRDNPEMLFVTAFTAILDLVTGELSYCNAGHDNPYVLRPGDTAIPRLDDGDGPPLCTVDGFDYRGARHRMQAGETICLVTDGVTEAQNAAEALYGNVRIEACLRELRDRGADPATIVAALRTDIAAFVGDCEASDDLSLIVLRWNGPLVAGA